MRALAQIRQGLRFSARRFRSAVRPDDFLQAVREQLKLKPAAIIVDTLSDEHEGEGGYLDWHDNEVEVGRQRMGGVEFAAACAATS
jgi:hypothetical protein